MRETTPRRLECTVHQSAELYMKGQKALLYHSGNMRLAVCLWVLCGLILLGSLGMTIAWNLSMLPMQWVLLIMLPLLIIYRLRWAHNAVKLAGKRFQEQSPDGPYDATIWVEGNRLFTSSKKGEGNLLLSSFQRLIFHQDIALLKTNAKLTFILQRDSYTDAQWRELCQLIRAENLKFKCPFK